jgi:hypothetical protein
MMFILNDKSKGNMNYDKLIQESLDNGTYINTDNLTLEEFKEIVDQSEVLVIANELIQQKKIYTGEIKLKRYEKEW